jgi:MoaA/NifB/PqqE/SkfB family radical SAM enzyme
MYRHDLEAAGFGSGHHAFRTPLPCPAEKFDPSLLEICFEDGTPLAVGGFFRAWTDVDLLTSPVTRLVNFEFTTRCNLRCTYCAVSLPDYVGEDFEVDDFDKLVEQLKTRKVKTVNVNGHGETTFVPGWDRRITTLADAGFDITIITNLARLLNPEELAVMARMYIITVSIDTHEKRLLSQIRRHVKLENILTNMRAIEAAADELKLPRPTFVWSCVVSDLVAMKLADFVRFGLTQGVKDYVLCNLVEHQGISAPLQPKNVLTLPREELAQFAKVLAEVKRLVREANGGLLFAGDLDELIDITTVKSAAVEEAMAL